MKNWFWQVWAEALGDFLWPSTFWQVRGMTCENAPPVWVVGFLTSLSVWATDIHRASDFLQTTGPQPWPHVRIISGSFPFWQKITPKYFIVNVVYDHFKIKSELSAQVYRLSDNVPFADLTMNCFLDTLPDIFFVFVSICIFIKMYSTDFIYVTMPIHRVCI